MNCCRDLVCRVSKTSIFVFENRKLRKKVRIFFCILAFVDSCLTVCWLCFFFSVLNFFWKKLSSQTIIYRLEFCRLSCHIKIWLSFQLAILFGRSNFGSCFVGLVNLLCIGLGFFRLNFRINFCLTTCCRLSERSENIKSLFNACGCISRVFFLDWIFRSSKKTLIFSDHIFLWHFVFGSIFVLPRVVGLVNARLILTSS